MTDRTPSELQIARKRLGLSLERTAVAAGISAAWLRQVERDSSLLSASVAARLLPVLQLRPEDLARRRKAEDS